MVPAAARNGQAIGATTSPLDWTVPKPEVGVRIRSVPGRLTAAATLVLGACSGGKGGGSASCGIAAMTGPLVVLQAFGKGNVLDQPPPDVPPRLPVRFVAGPVFRGTFTLDSAGTAVHGTLGTHPANLPAGYAVLVTDGLLRVQGAVIYEGVPVPGATVLGTLALPDTTLPLLGVRMDPRQIADPRCPLLPDSLR